MTEAEVFRRTRQFLRHQTFHHQTVVRLYTDANATLLFDKRLQPFQRFFLDLGDLVLHPDLVGQLSDGVCVFAVEAKGNGNMLKGLAQAEVYQSGFHWAQLRVGGARAQEQTVETSTVETSIDPCQSQVKKMIEAILAPARGYSLEPLLNEPLACTLDHSAADGQAKLLEPFIVHVLAMLVQVLVQLGKSITAGVGQILHLHGSPDIAKHILRILVAKHVPGLAKPRLGLFSRSIKTG